MLKQILAILCLYISVSGFAQVGFVSNLPYTENLSDVWHYAASDSTEYALVGVFNGLSIVSLADPTNPIEVQFIERPESIWRDIKTWGTHAYVTNESAGGLLIVDLSGLPGVIDTISYRARGLSSAHNIFIDENGVAYVVGANIDNSGATMLDLTVDPEAPVFVGAYDTRYVHDVYVRNDTMYTAEIANGEFAIVDVTDKSNPTIIATQGTPMGFSHNTWLSPDGNTLAVTEEYPESFTVTFDISDPTDIDQLGLFRSNWQSRVIPHNTFYVQDWLVTSSYTDGITVVDAKRPQNLIETGRFDTSPFPSQGSFNGCWGVDPYLPSGLILASDIEEGLFVLQPEYQRASWLEGTITNATTSNPQIYARIELIGSSSPDVITGFDGKYYTGNKEPGLYDVRISASGCLTQIFSDVKLQRDSLTLVDAILTCTSTAVIDPGIEALVFNVLPTLSNSNFNLEWSIPQSEFSVVSYIEVIDAVGRIRIHEKLENSSGNKQFGRNLSSGYYLVRIVYGDKQKSSRVIKR
ncbi:MAG: choice-of-anchor B domain-containing protein [Limisphaerales bacterium]|jgi:choice-of-anchor B domain-containing protein